MVFGGHPAIKQRHHLVSPKVMEAKIAFVDWMLDDDIIEPSKSDQSLPIVMAILGKLRKAKYI